MTTRALFYLLSASWVFTPSSAQITSIGSLPGAGGTLLSLATAGVKFGAGTPDSLVLLNTDLSTYRVLLSPTLPPGMIYGSGFYYITESLFDTDPTTIEFARDVQPDGTWTPTGIMIAREDGSVLFYSGTARFTGAGGVWSDLLASPPIADTPLGAVMVLVDVAAYVTYYYQLPGHLPCVDCNGLSVGTGSEQFTPINNPHLFTFPNPADETTQVQYILPEGATRGELVFFDAQGNEVKRLPVGTSGSLRVSTAQLPAATYLYHLETSQGIIGAKRLVVVR